MKFQKHDSRLVARPGLTLIELVIVIAILAALAALVVPKLTGMQDQANLSSASNNIGEVSKLIQTFEAKYNHSPAHMATLRLGVDGTGAMISTLHPNLVPFLQATSLDATQIKSLTDAGISHLHSHNMPAGTAPSETDGNGDVFLTSITTAPVVTLVKEDTGNYAPATWKPSTIMEARGLGVSPFMPRYANTHVVFGVGNISELKGKVMQEAPLMPVAQPEKYYARALAVYELPPAGTAITAGFKAQFVGVIGPDGSYQAKYQSDFDATKNQ